MAAIDLEYVVSACLAGFACRYDGGSRPCKQVMKLCKQGKALPVCPETLSGLPVPRLPCEQRNGKVLMRDGTDVTSAFEKGAELALEQFDFEILQSQSQSARSGA